MPLQQRTKPINERSASVATVKFLNASRNLEAPSSARYRIDDVTKNRRRSVLGWTTIATPSSSEDITVTAEQNRILDDCNKRERRKITVEATSLAGLQYRQTFTYEIKNEPATD